MCVYTHTFSEINFINTYRSSILVKSSQEVTRKKVLALSRYTDT